MPIVTGRSRSPVMQALLALEGGKRAPLEVAEAPAVAVKPVKKPLPAKKPAAKKTKWRAKR